MSADLEDEEVRALHEQLSLLCAGHKVRTTFAAVQDYFSGVITLAADNPDHADAVIDEIAKDLKATVRKNWDFYREHLRSHPPRPPGHA